MNLSAENEQLHKKALQLCLDYRRLEWRIVEVLRKIDEVKLYRNFEATSLFQYAVKFLGLSESTAYMLISVARKSAVVPKLESALRDQKISAAKAARIVSAITTENATELIEFATKNSIRAIDFEVARRSPRGIRRESAKPVSADHVELKMTISRAVFSKLERVKDLLAQKGEVDLNLAKALESMLEDYIKRHDPVEKAKRAAERRGLGKTELQPGEEHELCKTELQHFKPPKPGAIRKRQPLAAHEKHQVNARDGGRCTFVDRHGHRCENTRYLHIHHRQPVNAGGGNNPENLATLCSTHHDLVHQLGFPIDGQVSWLRQATIPYCALNYS